MYAQTFNLGLCAWLWAGIAYVNELKVALFFCPERLVVYVKVILKCVGGKKRLSKAKFTRFLKQQKVAVIAPFSVYWKHVQPLCLQLFFGNPRLGKAFKAALEVRT